MHGRIVAVNVARDLAHVAAGFQGLSGIGKSPAEGRVGLHGNTVAGDRVYDVRHHGGYDQAVYAYAREDASWWSGQLGREVTPGMFGENLSTEGIDVTGAVIGERWVTGSAVLEVSCPRIPCQTFAEVIGSPRWIRRFTEQAWPGAYLRIVVEGDVGAGDTVSVIERPEHGVTIGEVFRALTGDRALAPRLLEAPELPVKIRDKAGKWLAGTPDDDPPLDEDLLDKDLLDEDLT
ncbi:MAG: domain containing protein [Actinomycetia bacterium]|nr:domain containing protein [Actinomycetes bacterium]